LNQSFSFQQLRKIFINIFRYKPQCPRKQQPLRFRDFHATAVSYVKREPLPRFVNQNCVEPSPKPCQAWSGSTVNVGAARSSRGSMANSDALLGC
jgi:hypothetical protein